MAEFAVVDAVSYAVGKVITLAKGVGLFVGKHAACMGGAVALKLLPCGCFTGIALIGVRCAYRGVGEHLRKHHQEEYGAGKIFRRFARPAVLQDGSEEIEALERATGSNAKDPNSADNGGRKKRFCLYQQCNPDLLDYYINPPPAEEGMRECIVQVPSRCSHCHPDPVNEGMMTVTFYITHEQYHMLIALRGAKVASERKSIHAGVTAFCEGKAASFTRQSEFILEYFGLISNLQSCRLHVHEINWKVYIYRTIYDASVTRFSRCFGRHGPRFLRWAYEGLEVVDDQTGRDYASDWRLSARQPPLHVPGAAPGPNPHGAQLRVTPGGPAGPPAPIPPPGPAGPGVVWGQIVSGPGPPLACPPLVLGQPAPSSGPAILAPASGTGPAIPPVPTSPPPPPPGSGPSTTLSPMQLIDLQEQIVHEHDGELPVRMITNLTDTDKIILSDLSSDGTFPADRPGSHVISAEVCIMPGWTKDLILRYTGHIFRAAPLVSNTVVWDWKDVLTKAAAATVRVRQPGRWKLDDPTSDADPTGPVPAIEHQRSRAQVKRSIREFWKNLRNKVFSPVEIKTFVAHLPFIEELKSDKLTAERFMQLLNEMRADVGLPPVSANVKPEITCKPGKPPRIVMDCGLESSVTETIVAYVFDKLLFRHVGPASVKGRPRSECLDEITTECSVNKSGRKRCFVELDQTGFDGHNRVYAAPPGCSERVGIYLELAELFEYISVQIPKSSNECWKKFTVIASDTSAQTRHYLRFKSDNPKERWRATIEEIYMYSGKKYTSSGNWVCEACIDLCCNVFNPEIIWDQPLKNFNYIFKAFDHSRNVFYRFWLEGDDQFGWADILIARHAPLAALLYSDLGFEIKRVILELTGVDERAEFVGVHMLVRDGCTVPKMWVPDVARSLICSGAYLSTPDLSYQQHCGNMALSLMSRAVMMVGRCDPAAMYLRANARHWAKRSGASLESARLDTFKAEAWGHSDSGYTALKAQYNQLEAGGFTGSNQQRLLACSLQSTVSDECWARFVGNAPGVSPLSAASEVVTWFPDALRAKCMSTLC